MPSVTNLTIFFWEKEKHLVKNKNKIKNSVLIILEQFGKL